MISEHFKLLWATAYCLNTEKIRNFEYFSLENQLFDAKIIKQSPKEA